MFWVVSGALKLPEPRGSAVEVSIVTNRKDAVPPFGLEHLGEELEVSKAFDI